MNATFSSFDASFLLTSKFDNPFESVQFCLALRAVIFKEMIWKDYKGFPYLRLSIGYICFMVAFRYIHDKISPEKSLQGNCNCGFFGANPGLEAYGPINQDEDEDIDSQDRHPWFVRVFYLDMQTNTTTTQSCGGTLVSSRHVVTTAQCVTDENGAPLNMSQMYVNFNPQKNSVFGESKVPMQKRISKVTIHEDWVHLGLRDIADGHGFFDIAVVELENEVNLRLYTPICIAKEAPYPDHYRTELVEVLGFKNRYVGKFHSNENYEELTKNVIVKKSCTFPHYKSRENADHFCAVGDDTVKVGAGGPVMIRDFYTNQYTFIGIFSGSWYGYGRVWERSVFTKVSILRQWILKQMQSATFCGEKGPNAGYPLTKIVHCPLLPYIRDALHFTQYLNFIGWCGIAIDLTLRFLSYMHRAPAPARGVVVAPHAGLRRHRGQG